MCVSRSQFEHHSVLEVYIEVPSNLRVLIFVHHHHVMVGYITTYQHECVHAALHQSW